MSSSQCRESRRPHRSTLARVSPGPLARASSRTPGESAKCGGSRARPQLVKLKDGRARGRYGPRWTIARSSAWRGTPRRDRRRSPSRRRNLHHVARIIRDGASPAFNDAGTAARREARERITTRPGLRTRTIKATTRRPYGWSLQPSCLCWIIFVFFLRNVRANDLPDSRIPRFDRPRRSRSGISSWVLSSTPFSARAAMRSASW